MKVNLPRWVRTCIYRTCILFPLSIKHKKILRRIRKTNHVTVVFMASNLSMWRYQNLIESMKKDPRFEVHVLLAPFLFYSPDAATHSVNQLKVFFQSVGFDYIDTTVQETRDIDFMQELSPDIVFYQQPYGHILEKKYDSHTNRHRLLAYYPYGLSTIDTDWQYRLKFNNYAWKIYYASERQKSDAVQHTYNSGRNMIAVGDPDYDRFLAPVNYDEWKTQNVQKKRIIWAPHFSITPGKHLCRDSFTWMSSFMIDMAKKYSDSIQIAFKPHPHLLHELYSHPDWGKEKTDTYYQLWQAMDNGQLVEGDFINLFKTSDALIHDCGTFTAEYLYTRKPVMFVSGHIETEREQMNVLGKAAISAHYQGKDVMDVEYFISEIVLGGCDPMKVFRESFYSDYLRPFNGNSVTSNTITDMVESLWPC